jgi:hypothetical protein
VRNGKRTQIARVSEWVTLLCSPFTSLPCLSFFAYEYDVLCKYQSGKRLLVRLSTKSTVYKSQDRQMYVCHNIEACRVNHCCSGKAISITYCVCMCFCSLKYAACNAHVPYYIFICGLCRCNVFLCCIMNHTILREKKSFWTWNMCFWFNGFLTVHHSVDLNLSPT